MGFIPRWARIPHAIADHEGRRYKKKWSPQATESNGIGIFISCPYAVSRGKTVSHHLLSL